MQGLPPLQALVLLVVLSLLGFAGKIFIGVGEYKNPEKPAPKTATSVETVTAEIELVFSSPPTSYKLVRPSDSGGEDIILLQSSKVADNPCYGNVTLTAHELLTYWLDVRWPDEPGENSQHFVQIQISPDHGESRKFAFYTSYKGIDETFDYSNGEAHHE